MNKKNTIFTITLSRNTLPPYEREQRLKTIRFGRVFTDHMAVLTYRNGTWQDAEIKAYGPLSLDPASSVLHYGQAVFEGFKAYRQPDNSICLFRPDANAERFNRSAQRLAMPQIPKELFIEASEALVSIDRDWVPSGPGESLYLRPFMIAIDPFLGVQPSKDYMFVLIASPAGEYFSQGIKPVNVWVSKDYVRAAPGGTGEAKCAGNYAASLLAQAEAKKQDCDQVIWLDATQREVIEEMGGMNLFFVYRLRGRSLVVTPALTGTLLAGITRSTLLTLAVEMGMDTYERTLTITEVLHDLESGAITEVFACGTAAVITPVGRIKGPGFDQIVNGGVNGPVAMGLRELLLGLQRGTLPDQHGWLHRVALD